MPDREKEYIVQKLQEALEKAENDGCFFAEIRRPIVFYAITLLKEQEEVPKANGWISVKDRLPEKEGQYLCWFGKNTMAKGAAIATYLERWKSFGSLESLVTYPNVTHWMPIESPEEVKNWMTDREKVIKGLKCCAHTDGTNCVYCPYDNADEDCTALMSMDVLDLLKEQDAVEPKLDVDAMVCGNCGHNLVHQERLGDNVLFEERHNYCPQCGKKVKWE